MQEANQAAIKPESQAETLSLLKRIGSATVEVTVHFSSTSQETMADIVRRLIEREVDHIA